MKKTTLLFIIAVTALFSSCDNNNTHYVQRNKVVILNQGNYSEQNASVYMYDEDNQSLIPNTFESANSGQKLGATLMSGTFASTGVGYLLCSNPDKIEVVDILTTKVLTQPITAELSNVREIIIGGGYIFVTNFGTDYTVLPNGSWEYTNSYVSIYNGMTNAFVTKIEVGSDAQGMLYDNNTLYVATKGGIVTIRHNANTFIKDEETYKDEMYTGYVKYLCMNNNIIYASVPGYGVFAYDPIDNRTRNRYEMPMDMDGFITMDRSGDIYSYATIYDSSWNVESSNAYKLDVSAGTYQTIVNGEYLYSIGVSPYSGNIYTSEANGFTVNSTMNITNPDTGNLIDTKVTGVGTFRYLFCSYLEVEEEEK